jgi:DNA-binding HxlR family transcriptional regulator
MKKEPNSAVLCTHTLKLLGDFWTLAIINALRDGASLRYCELQRLLGMVNPVTLSNRLHALEEEGLIERNSDPEDKVAVIYSLSTLGEHAVPVLDALDRFSKKMKK